MKRCPSCQQTYPDDAPDYCSNDGTRLMAEESDSFDPEKTMMASGLRGSEPFSASPPPPPSAPPPLPSSSAPPPQQQYKSPGEPQGIKPPTGWQPQSEQPQQPWQSPASQPVQQGWQSPAPAQNWGGAPHQQPAASDAPYPAPYAPASHGGRSRALAIAALVTGACAATIMAIRVADSRDFFFASWLVLAILGIGLGVTSLILSLQKPARFGGLPLAIAGLATGTAALVYYFTL
ncbi:MAG: hypothetical protein H0U54_05300 [Acidobacteria bacterium]|nr:hypothetical protein [Acidobacteriota bacterium]